MVCGCPRVDFGHFYPRSPCGERPAHFAQQIHSVGISIHALLAESDQGGRKAFPRDCNFYPRSPCGERHFTNAISDYLRAFLSTLSLRRATTAVYGACRAGRISIHALLAESDAFLSGSIKFCNVFLSTLSLRRATQCRTLASGIYGISIHALLAESDPHIHSTSPGHPCISIHALLAESDCCCCSCTVHSQQFLSTLSLRRATSDAFAAVSTLLISIHALLAESDLFCAMQIVIIIVFLSTLSLRRATLNPIKPRRFHYHFYPRSPCGERPPQSKI